MCLIIASTNNPDMLEELVGFMQIFDKAKAFLNTITCPFLLRFGNRSKR